jgi:hypothetical protein
MGVYKGIAQDNVTISSGRAKLGFLSRGIPAIKTASFTVADDETHIVCNGAASITVTLPSASTWVGREIFIKTMSAATNVKPIATNTAGTAILAGTAGTWALLVSDGTNWVVMAS